MRVKRIGLFHYDELPARAKRRAHSDWLSRGLGHMLSYEVRDTMDALEKELGISVTSWSYDAYGHRCGPIWFRHYSDGQLALAGNRARAFLWNNFGHLVMQPRDRWYAKHEDGRVDLNGGLRYGEGWRNHKRES